jgi:hypothetical protein
VTASRKDREQEGERRRRLAAAFGDPLPESTSDDRPEGWGDGASSPRGGAGDDEWLRSQVPPHHG